MRRITSDVLSRSESARISADLRASSADCRTRGGSTGAEVRAAIPTPAAAGQQGSEAAGRGEPKKRCWFQCGNAAVPVALARLPRDPGSAPLFRLPLFWFSALNSQPTVLTSLARWARVQSVSIQNARFYTQCMFFTASCGAMRAMHLEWSPECRPRCYQPPLEGTSWVPMAVAAPTHRSVGP